MTSEYVKAAELEHRFWLQVMGDHARFLHQSLAPIEGEEIETAKYFINKFDRLLGRVDTTDLIHLSLRAEEEVKKLRSFKLEIIEKQLTGKIKIHLVPTYMNHMVNEAEEFLRMLKYLKNGEVPPIFHEIHYHIFWLQSAAGNAKSISMQLDFFENKKREESQHYSDLFKDYYLKAVEFSGFLRTNLVSYPALKRLNTEIMKDIQSFMTFLQDLEDLCISEKIQGILTSLFADHIFRENCYYLQKVGRASAQDVPLCNPGKPRKGF